MSNLSYRENFIVDSTLSMAAVALVAPLRTVNLRMQLTKDKYDSPLDCIQELGFSSLWKGNMWRCVRLIPSRIIDITTEERLPFLLRNIPGVWQTIFSSILGSTLSLALVYPIDVHLIKLINKMGPVDKSDEDEEIFFDLSYIGFPAAVARMVAYYSSYYLLHWILKYSFPSRINNMDGIQLGFYLQLGADCLSYPLDTISRVQVTKEKSFKQAFNWCKEEGFNEGFYHSYKWNFCISLFGMLVSLGAVKLKTFYTSMRCK